MHVLLQVNDGMYSAVRRPQKEVNLIDFDSDVASGQPFDSSQQGMYDNSGKDPNLFGDFLGGATYDNSTAQGQAQGHICSCTMSQLLLLPCTILIETSRFKS